jgi:hypothetical protein
VGLLASLWRRFFGARPSKTAAPAVPRIDYLLGIYHDWLEKREEAYGGLNFLGLTDRQLDEGQADLAARNIGRQVGYAFQLANLYWGQGQVDRAEQYLRLAFERHERVAAICAEQGWDTANNSRLHYAKCAALLLGCETGALTSERDNGSGYDPWFQDALVGACLSAEPFDMGAWQANVDLWTKRRFPKYRLAEFDVYVKALTGQFETTDAMFAAHRRMFAGRAKRPNADWAMIDGYQDNDLVIDYLFAAILKRIGWEGEYRHSWPTTHPDPAFVNTRREPDRFLAIAETKPQPRSDTGLIADVAAARAHIDRHLPGQMDEEGAPLDARRPERDGAKVAAALKALGWQDDGATLALMTAWRMDHVLNDSTHLTLCDPLAKGAIGLGSWTRLLVDDFGMHPDFIAIVGSEDKRDYRDPQGGWYVYWKKDGRIHLVQRDEWDRPEVAVATGRPGLTLWPSYDSFVAWWVEQHRTSLD